MSWSTKELAEIAHTTVRTIRHYHHVGVLPEPERGSNGYKKYQVEHLLRVLQIRRLTSIGMTLSQVHRALDDPAEGIAMLDALDAELDNEIGRLRRAQAEVRAARTLQLPPELPSALVTQFGFDVADASPNETDLIFLASQIDDLALADGVTDLNDPILDDLSTRFRQLPPEASSEECELLASALWDATSALLERSVALWEPTAAAVAIDQRQEQVMDAAITEYLNPAQARVLNRVIQWARDRRDQQLQHQEESDSDND